VFLYMIYMTSSNIPDGISFADLQEFARDAKPEAEAHKCDGPYDGYTEQQLRRGIDEALEALHDRFGHPMTAKYILMETLQALMIWHTKRGVAEFEDGDNGCGVAWLRDAGILQAAMQSVHNVSLPDDWMVGGN
jgi:hypothetical protein